MLLCWWFYCAGDFVVISLRWWCCCAGGDVVVLVSCLYEPLLRCIRWDDMSARCMQKNIRFPIAEVCTRSPRTWIHSGSWLPSCIWKFRSIYASSTLLDITGGFTLTKMILATSGLWSRLTRRIWFGTGWKYQSDTSRLFGWLHIRKVRSLGYTFWNQDELHDFIVSELKPKLCLKLGCHLLGCSVSKRAILDYP